MAASRTFHGPGDRQVSARVVWAWFWFSFLAFWPRLILAGLWWFGDEVEKAFGPAIIPVLGFLFLPSTTLAYALMWGATSDGVVGWEWIVVALGLLIDLYTWWLITDLGEEGD
jgi:hypothetical protein